MESDGTNPSRTIDEWLALLAERPLGEEETEAFRVLLRGSPEALDRYLDHCEIETWLAAAGPIAGLAKGTGDTVETETTTKTPLRIRSRLRVAAAGLAAAALVALAVYLAGGGVGPGAEEGRAPEVDVAGGAAPDAADESTDEFTELVGAADRGPSPEGDGTIAEIEDKRRPEAGARDPWKVINATGAVKHPGLKDKTVPAVALDRPVQFNRDIRPILSETCFHCHGPDEHGRRADLRLDSIEGATADLGGTVAIVPGDPKKSEAWWRIVSDDPDELMPPPESHLVLTQEQKALIRRWIAEGAEYEGHYAYEAPVRPTPPETAKEWGRNEIDAFILRRLGEEGMEPSPEADPRTLIRRLTFDLTGLPPTMAEIESFVEAYAGDPETTWQGAITRLLDSPHFGERMATPWLDQARYADTNGYSIDGGRDMWLWRDWVIEAYNDNLPFDQFTVEQIAGDLLPDATPAQIVATGFNRNHMITHEGGTIPAENLTNYAADRVKTTSEVFLGLTMACAQCHDHKYDPISMKDYYRFFSFFNELSDKGLDGNAGRNARPTLDAKTVLPGDELPEVRDELARVRREFTETTEGFGEWLAEVREENARRGEGFSRFALETLDASSPNRPGPYEVLDDGSVYVSKPSRGLNAFSHVFRLPEGEALSGIRIRFFPDEKTGKLTPHPEGVPMITTVLASSGKLPAKQVEFHNQETVARATASSHPPGHEPIRIADERNLNWWKPGADDPDPYLNVTFSEPISSDDSPYLTVMIFYGASGSLPFHWKVEGFSGTDPDSRFPGEVVRILEKDESAWTAGEREQLLATFRADAGHLEPLRIRLANLEERIDVLTEPHSTLVMDTAKKPRETFILERGQYDAPTEKVTSGVPEILPPLSDDGKEVDRLDLARWMTDPGHPLTARVAVNRLWQIFFGTGIVATTADFGSQGEWPSHPGLLDWLAVEFVESGWDQKALIRRIVGSATYRQSSSATPVQRERDPNNRLLARGPRFRLAAEFVRDQVLAHSGLLVPRIGGPSVQPYQPAGLWKEVSHFGSTPATKQVFVQDRGEKLYRRSLYTIVKRTSSHPSMAAFDAPNREMCITERGVTNTPLQALVTLNDPQFAEAARVFAARILVETAGEDDADRIDEAFRRVTGRPPKVAERNALASFLSDERARYAADRAAAEELISVGEWPVATGVDPVEQAVWTQVTSLIFNLSETLTRS